jgi:hypothetical protein
MYGRKEEEVVCWRLEGQTILNQHQERSQDEEVQEDQEEEGQEGQG